MSQTTIDPALKAALGEIKDAFKEAEHNLKTHLDTQAEEIRTLGGTTKETAEKIKTAEQTLERISADLVEATKRIDQLEAESKRSLAGVGPDLKGFKSFGELLVGSEAYKEYVGNGNPSGKSRPISVKTFFRNRKTTLTGASLGDVPGYLYSPERLAEIIAGPDRMDRVRDLLPVNQTTSGAIEFVRETGFTNAAAAVPEAPQAGKPESGISFEIVSTSVKTIAHWLPATRQIIADAAQLRSYIDNRLLIGLALEEDEQLLYGDGQGANVQGILTDAGIQTFTPAQGKPKDTKVDLVRRAMTRARLAEYPISGVVIHPLDWEDIELLKGSDDHYIWTQVTVGGEMRLWRAPVVETTAINEGEFLTGAFELGAAIWDREDAAIRVSDSHDKFFIQNLWAILAEERLALTIYRPEAFVHGFFEEAS